MLPQTVKALPLIAIAILPGVSFADGANGSGISLGLRTGYAVPLGSSVQDTQLSQLIQGMIPIGADVGWKFNSRFYVGGFFQYGIGLAPSACSGTFSCSLHDLRIGFDAHYHFLPRAFFDPWAGLGLGWEILNQSFSGTLVGAPIASSNDMSGFEFVNVQLGGDFKVTSNVGVGPFAALTVSEFSNGISTGTKPPVKSVHQWLILGVRGVFDIRL